MAEELLGVGFDIHGGGNDLVFPHHENEAAQTRMAPRRRARADLDAQRHAPDGRREDGQERRQHRVCSATSSSAGGATPSSSSSSPATTASRSSSATRARGGADAARGGSARPRAQLGAGPSPDGAPAAVEQFFDALADDFNTPRALAEMWMGCARPTSAGRRATTTCVEMLTVLGLETLLDAGRRGPRRMQARRSCSPRARRREPRKTGTEPIACATSSPRCGWEVRDGADGPELVRAVIIYGRNAVHEALRAGRRRIHEIWATDSVARADLAATRRAARSSASTTAESPTAATARSIRASAPVCRRLPLRERRRAARESPTR